MSSGDKLRIFLSAPLSIADVEKPMKLSRVIEEVLGDHDVDIAVHGVAGEAQPAPDISVYQNITRADLVVADITGGNPNVMYEVGFAHALRKPVILLADRTTPNIPHDLAGRLVIINDPAEPAVLRRNIGMAAERYMPAATK
jgi:hypothetical protein